MSLPQELSGLSPRDTDAAEHASSGSRLPTLTGMRFVAAAAVVLCHFSLYIRGNPDFWRNLGQVGVSFFFVLSGFVLTWSARPGTPARAVWRARAAKIFPNHLLVGAAHAGLMLLTGKAIVAAQILPTATLTQSWIPGFDLTTAVSPVSWTLSCEVFFYLTFPLLLARIRRIPATYLWCAACALVAVIFTLPTIAEQFVPHGKPMSPLLPYLDNHAWFVDFFPLARAFEFALGMVLARIVAAGKWVQLGMAPAAVLFVLAYWLSMGSGLYSFSAATVIPIAMLICSGAVADVEGRPSPLRHPYLVRLGEISFALYLVHKPVIDYGMKLLGIPHFSGMALVDQVATLAPLLGVALLLAWLLYVGVERPVTRYWGRRRPRRAAGHRATCRECPARTCSGRPSPDDHRDGEDMTGAPAPR
ncbi:acyltransferase family protein [Streptomyces noboritoensis]|uniref:Acyltransferase family protein n=1 Tax=Streptomyces noboritoensis TaxID=67337 RepID=A0ABV6T9P2_9ACTN